MAWGPRSRRTPASTSATTSWTGTNLDGLADLCGFCRMEGKLLFPVDLGAVLPGPPSLFLATGLSESVHFSVGNTKNLGCEPHPTDRPGLD